MANNVFISYQRADSQVAARLADSLEARGLTVFRDMSTLVAGEVISNEITDAISKADAVVALLSAHSKRSSWVDRELRSALWQEKVTLPILLDSDARNNWIWPLVSDRVSVTVDSETDFSALGARLEEAIVRAGRRTIESQQTKNIFSEPSIAINVGLTLTNVAQTVAISSSNRRFKEEVQMLLDELQDALKSVPPERREDAERVALSAQMAISEGVKEFPNDSFLKIAGEGLKEAAKLLTDTAPAVASVAERIVNLLKTRASTT